MDAFAMFKPFMIDNEYLYRSDNVRALMSMIKEKEKHLLPWYPEKLDWYDYWLNVHFPGMRKWVLPTLEEDLKIQEKRSYTYQGPARSFRHVGQTLSDTRRDADRTQRAKGAIHIRGRSELTLRAAGFFAKNGIKQRRPRHSVFEQHARMGNDLFRHSESRCDRDPDRSGKLGRRDR